MHRLEQDNKTIKLQRMIKLQKKSFLFFSVLRLAAKVSGRAICRLIVFAAK